VLFDLRRGSFRTADLVSPSSPKRPLFPKDAEELRTWSICLQSRHAACADSHTFLENGRFRRIWLLAEELEAINTSQSKPRLQQTPAELRLVADRCLLLRQVSSRTKMENSTDWSRCHVRGHRQPLLASLCNSFSFPRSIHASRNAGRIWW